MLQICDGTFVSPSSQAIIQNPQRLDQWWSPHWTSIFSLSRILEHKLTWHHICNGNHWFPQWMIAVTRTCWKVPTQIIIMELGFFVFVFFNWDGEISLLGIQQEDELKGGDAAPFGCWKPWDEGLFSISRFRSHMHTNSEHIDHSRSLAWKAIQLIADWQAKQRQVWLQGES